MDKSLINKNYQDSGTSNGIDMKLGSVTNFAEGMQQFQ